MNTEHENKMDQIIEETLKDLSDKDVIYESLSASDINVILANAPDIPMTDSFKERARTAMKGEYVAQQASSPEIGLESIFSRAKSLNIAPQELALRVTKTVEINGKKYLLDDVAYILQHAEEIFQMVDAEILRNHKHERMLKNTFVQFMFIEVLGFIFIILSLASML